MFHSKRAIAKPWGHLPVFSSNFKARCVLLDAKSRSHLVRLLSLQVSLAQHLGDAVWNRGGVLADRHQGYWVLG